MNDERFTELLMKLPQDDRALYQARYYSEKKNPTTALVITLLLGGVGGHRFYLGDVGLGVVYLLFCWTFIPCIVAFVELFLIMGRTRAYSDDIAERLYLVMPSVNAKRAAAR